MELSEILSEIPVGQETFWTLACCIVKKKTGICNRAAGWPWICLELENIAEIRAPKKPVPIKKHKRGHPAYKNRAKRALNKIVPGWRVALKNQRTHNLARQASQIRATVKNNEEVFRRTLRRREVIPVSHPRMKQNGEAKYPYDHPVVLEFYQSFAWRKLRLMCIKRDRQECACCGATRSDGVKMNVDHIKPLRFFWHLRLDINNLQILCEVCNHGKGNWDHTDWRQLAPA